MKLVELYTVQLLEKWSRKYKKSINYNIERIRFSILTSVFGVGVLLFFTIANASLPSGAKSLIELRKDEFSNIEVSPSGKYISTIMRTDDRNTLVILDRKTGKPIKGKSVRYEEKDNMEIATIIRNKRLGKAKEGAAHQEHKVSAADAEVEGGSLKGRAAETIQGLEQDGAATAASSFVQVGPFEPRVAPKRVNRKFPI